MPDLWRNLPVRCKVGSDVPVSVMRNLIVIILSSVLAIVVMAGYGYSFTGQWYHDHERGWFWYEDPPPEKLPEKLPEKPPEPPRASVYRPEEEPPSGPPVLSAQWIRENLEKYRLLAIDDPTPENVAAYMYIQRVMLDKSQRFAEQVKHVVQMDPYLDQGTRRPIASYGGALMSREALAAQQRLLARIARQAGIFFFFQSQCGHCEIQAPVLKNLHDRYGFVVFPVSMDGLPLRNGMYPNFARDRGQAQRLRVVQTPAMFLGRPDTQDIIPLGQSTLSLDQLEKRILVAALDAGWITSEEYNRTRGFNADFALELRPGMLPANLDEKQVVDHIRKLYAERFIHQGSGGLGAVNGAEAGDGNNCSECGYVGRY